MAYRVRGGGRTRGNGRVHGSSRIRRQPCCHRGNAARDDPQPLRERLRRTIWMAPSDRR